MTKLLKVEVYTSKIKIVFKLLKINFTKILQNAIIKKLMLEVLSFMMNQNSYILNYLKNKIFITKIMQTLEPLII